MLQELPRNPGTYILVVEMREAREVAVGRLGRWVFPAGWYLYVGSALGGLAGRVGRHLRREKRLHWHIDYLLAHGTVQEVWYRVGAERRECALAQRLAALPGAERYPPRFGASDCRCPGHLVRFVGRPPLEALGFGGFRHLSRSLWAN